MSKRKANSEEHSQPKQFKLELMDSALLAAAQLIQPATPEEVFDFVQASDWAAELSNEAVAGRCKKLRQVGFLWTTADKRLVLTPLGSSLAVSSLPVKQRDKLRLLILNKSRHTKELRWMHG